jgi:protein tyrosine/serine phosphatase
MNVPRFIRRLFRAPYDGLRHFGVVEEGRVYRCGQPTPEQLAGQIETLGLRTVVSLRGSRDEDDPDGWEAAERDLCVARGVRFVAIPCNHKNPPTREQVEAFIELARDPQRTPLLVHCRLGQQRTLLFCALHRVHNQNVPPDAALREMDELGFNIRHRRHQRLLAAFHQFSRAVACDAR